MTNRLTKDEIVASIVNDYFEDEDFINKLNNITYAQKIKLNKHQRPGYAVAVEEKPKQFGDPSVNEMLTVLKKKIGIEAFVDSSIERNMAKHCIGLMEKIGSHEFERRLNGLLSDAFHAKNCNKIRYIYNNIKGFIEPQSNII